MTTRQIQLGDRIVRHSRTGFIEDYALTRNAARLTYSSSIIGFTSLGLLVKWNILCTIKVHVSEFIENVQHEFIVKVIK